MLYNNTLFFPIQTSIVLPLTKPNRLVYSIILNWEVKDIQGYNTRSYYCGKKYCLVLFSYSVLKRRSVVRTAILYTPSIFYLCCQCLHRKLLISLPNMEIVEIRQDLWLAQNKENNFK